MTKRTGFLFIIWIIGVFTACSPPLKVDILPNDYVLSGRNYTLAIYDDESRLLTHPINDLIARQKQTLPCQVPLSDIYVVSHGWNYTIPEAIANYHRYIDIVDAEMKALWENNHDPQGCKSPFQPYFIFITWTSVSRPVSDLASAVLPYELDDSIRPVTGIADKAAFFIPTVWKQSLNAATIALGKRSPEKYRQDYQHLKITSPNPCNQSRQDDFGRCYGVDLEQMGRYFPASSIVYELFRLNGEESFNNGRKVKIHVVGHSYGAKLAALAAVEALRRWILETRSLTRKEFEANQDDFVDASYAEGPPLESLVMINPAMNPREFRYVVDVDCGFPVRFNPARLLRLIPRKAIVYSKYDYPNGLYFDVSQIVLNNEQTQFVQTFNYNFLQSVRECSNTSNAQQSMPEERVLGEDLKETKEDIVDRFIFTPYQGATQLIGNVVARCSVGWLPSPTNLGKTYRRARLFSSGLLSIPSMPAKSMTRVPGKNSSRQSVRTVM